MLVLQIARPGRLVGPRFSFCCVALLIAGSHKGSGISAYACHYSTWMVYVCSSSRSYDLLGLHRGESPYRACRYRRSSNNHLWSLFRAHRPLQPAMFAYQVFTGRGVRMWKLHPFRCYHDQDTFNMSHLYLGLPQPTHNRPGHKDTTMCSSEDESSYLYARSRPQPAVVP